MRRSPIRYLLRYDVDYGFPTFVLPFVTCDLLYVYVDSYTVMICLNSRCLGDRAIR